MNPMDIVEELESFGHADVTTKYVYGALPAFIEIRVMLQCEASVDPDQMRMDLFLKAQAAIVHMRHLGYFHTEGPRIGITERLSQFSGLSLMDGYLEMQVMES